MYLVLTGVMLAMLLAMLDQMIVNTALPRIVGDLGGLSHYSWVVTAYLLAATVTTPIWGKLGDLYGQKGVYLSAIGLFLAGSALSGMATSMTGLIAFRAFQGLGAGGLMVGAMSIMGVLVPPRERGKYQGLMAAIMPLAMIGGPLLGGFITDHLSWRWAFYVNLPVGVVAVAMIVATLKLPRLRTSHRVDYLGAALLALGVGALVLITTWGGSQYAWGSTQIAGLGVVSVLALAGFVLVERKAAEPIVPLWLFRNRNFAVVSVLGFLVGFTMFGATLVLPQYQQMVLGDSATMSGLALLPLMLGMVAVSLVSGQIITRTGKYRMFPIVGGALMVVGLLALTQLGLDTGRVLGGALMVPLGLGMGAMMQTLMTVSQNSVELKDMGAASSAVTFFRSIGGSFGTAVFGAILTSRMTAGLTDRLGPAAAEKLTSGGSRLTPEVLAKMPSAVHDAYLHAFSGAMGSVFWWALPAAALVFLLAWLVKQVPLRGSAPTPEPVREREPEPAAA
ncbi:MDR family MFS transporter [Actinocatenispora rupis]|uniref:MFS transporter n=1 Tax=Actinocatenispora rupis TaxID=519421 RepID=A0A8J3JAZ4_9ACTN|nr:MDR family MFS transporter [Actinocatenispora rupis]GID15092.1 MFS transporter [Actinocatenispora rupis]